MLERTCMEDKQRKGRQWFHWRITWRDGLERGLLMIPSWGESHMPGDLLPLTFIMKMSLSLIAESETHQIFCAFEMWVFKNLAAVPWMDRKTNDEVLDLLCIFKRKKNNCWKKYKLISKAKYIDHITSKDNCCGLTSQRKLSQELRHPVCCTNMD